jgi:hypothetical protein
MDNPMAIAFDSPVDSGEHRLLAETVWMGGPIVSIRYWLGRLLRRNLFRESHESVLDSLQDFIRDIGSDEAAPLFADSQSWYAAVAILRHRWEMLEGLKPTQKPRYVAVLLAFITNPDLTNLELASAAGITEKQIVRMSDVFILRKIQRLAESREE